MSRAPQRCKVLIAGAGVAGIEALLALGELAGDLVDTTLLAPSDRFVYRPLLVAEPFGIASATSFELAPLIAETGARHLHDSLASVDPGTRTVTTGAGAELTYDALLVAAGARPVAAVPGALSFGTDDERSRFGALLGELGRRGVKRLAVVVPPLTTWSIAAYELALLTAHERDLRRLGDVELFLVTNEGAPLQLLGAEASELVGTRLREARVTLHTDCAAERYEGGELHFAQGDPLAVDRVVALPTLEVPPIPGLSQREHGFVVTDVNMHAFGLESVWAAGDVTSFPIKQGGLAAQQADVAARSIAAHAGAHVPVEPFRPVLRAAMLTGEAPDYMRSSLARPLEGDAVAREALWWPPLKLAGRYLAPYLARATDIGGTPDELVDLEPSDDPPAAEDDHEQAQALLLATADADAGRGDFAGALRWLGMVERLNLVLPQEYVARRHQWMRELDPATARDAAAGRLEPGLVDAATAISDLERRIGWLRETERRNEREMRAHHLDLDRGIEQVIALSKKVGIDG